MAPEHTNCENVVFYYLRSLSTLLKVLRFELKWFVFAEKFFLWGNVEVCSCFMKPEHRERKVLIFSGKFEEKLEPAVVNLNWLILWCESDNGQLIEVTNCTYLWTFK